jgi:hypothetical protein
MRLTPEVEVEMHREDLSFYNDKQEVKQGEVGK